MLTIFLTVYVTGVIVDFLNTIVWVHHINDPTIRSEKQQSGGWFYFATFVVSLAWFWVILVSLKNIYNQKRESI